MRFLFVIAVLLASASPALADCVDPVGESATQTGSSVTLHTYPEESIVCIAAPTDYCEECEAGYEHICRHDRWAPLRSRACDTSVEPLSLALTTGYTRGESASDSQIDSSGRTDARRLFDAAKSCEFRTDADDTFTDFMEEVVEAGLQNAPMSELTRYMRNELAVEIPQELREAQAERAAAPPEEREMYDETIRWIENERAALECVLRLTGSLP